MSPTIAGAEDEPVAVVVVVSSRAKMDDDGVQDDDAKYIDAEEAEEADEVEEDQAGVGVEADGRGRHRCIFGGFASEATPQSLMQLNRRNAGEELNRDAVTVSTAGEKKRTHEVPSLGHSAGAAEHKRVRLPPGSYKNMAKPRGRDEEPDMNMELVLSTGNGTNHFMGVTWHCKLGKWHATKGKTHLGYYTNELDAARAYSIEVKRLRLLVQHHLPDDHSDVGNIIGASKMRLRNTARPRPPVAGVTTARSQPGRGAPAEPTVRATCRVPPRCTVSPTRAARVTRRNYDTPHNARAYPVADW